MFQRTPNFSIPARNQPLTAEDRRWWKENYPEMRRRAREEMRNGIVTEIPDKGALDDSAEARAERFESRWARGGLTFMTAYNNLALEQAANDTAADFVRGKIAATVEDPAVAKTAAARPPIRSAPSASASTPTISRRSTGRTSPSSISARRRSSEITPDGIVPATRIRARRDRVRDRLRCDDRVVRQGRHPRSRRLTLNGKWAEGPKTYLGLMVAGFPEPVHHHRSGQPVGAVEHDGVDRAARRLDRRLSRLSARARHRPHRGDAEAEDEWVAHVNEVAHNTLYPQANSWYMGANVPGKPRIFMPYIGGVHVYRRICDAVVAKGYEGFALTRREQVRAAE